MATSPDLDQRVHSPIYSVAEAAWYLRLPQRLVRDWAFGRCSTGDRLARAPVIGAASASPPALSFVNLAELLVLAAIRHHHGVSMTKVKRMVDHLKGHGVRYPLLETLWTNGEELFTRDEHLVAVSKGGQLAHEAAEQCLERIHRGPSGAPLLLAPWRKDPGEPARVELALDRAGGRLVIKGTRVPVSIVAERFEAGDSVEFLMDDYRLASEQVQEAIRWGAPTWRSMVARQKRAS